MLPQNSGLRLLIYVVQHSRRGKTLTVPLQKPEILFICYALHLIDDVCTLFIGPDDMFSTQMAWP